MNIWEFVVLFLSVILGGGLALYLQKNNRQTMQLMLSFSGAYILGISVLHLMPTVFNGTVTHVGLWILVGFFIQLLLEQLSGGVEHGHVHAPHDNRGRFAMQVMIGLCLHAFMEGLPLGGTYEQLQHVHDHHHHGHHHLLLGIILHKAPAAFALVLLFSLSGFGKGRIVGALLLFALMSPLGAGLATYFNSRGWLAVTDQTIIVAIVIGSFLHIATTILFETDNSQQHRIPLRKLFSIVVGIGLAILTVLL